MISPDGPAWTSAQLNSSISTPDGDSAEKYQGSDVSVLTVERLADAQARRRFVAGVFDKERDTPEVPFKFSSAKVDFAETKPDFNDQAFDLLRACFRYDLAQARALIPQTRFGDSLLDNAELDPYLETR